MEGDRHTGTRLGLWTVEGGDIHSRRLIVEDVVLNL